MNIDQSSSSSTSYMKAVNQEAESYFKDIIAKFTQDVGVKILTNQPPLEVGNFDLMRQKFKTQFSNLRTGLLNCIQILQNLNFEKCPPHLPSFMECLAYDQLRLEINNQLRLLAKKISEITKESQKEFNRQLKQAAPSSSSMPVVNSKEMQKEFENRLIILKDKILEANNQSLTAFSAQNQRIAQSLFSTPIVNKEETDRKFNEMLERLNNKILRAVKGHDIFPHVTSEKNKYKNFFKFKANLISVYLPKGKDRFIAMAIPSKLQIGTYYHTTSSFEKINKILTKGIEIGTPSTTSSDESELGLGLRFTFTGVSFDQKDIYRFGVQTLENIPTIRVFYKNELLNNPDYQCLQLTPSDIQNGLAEIAKRYSIIQWECQQNSHANEFVLLNPNQNFKPTSIDKGVLFSESQSYFLLPSHLWHTQWQPKPDPIILSQPGEDTYQIYDQIQLKSWTFKEIPNVLNRAAELGASGLARHILPGLILPVEESRFREKIGIRREWINYRTLHGMPLDQIKPHQYDQLFAHSLVDWVISNPTPFQTDFAIDNQQNVIAYNKSRAFKYFKGSQVQSALASRGVEKNLDKIRPLFTQLDEDSSVGVHAHLRALLKKKEIKIDFTKGIIQDTIKCIVNLTKDDIRNYLGEYARLAFGDREQLFLDSVFDRCQNIEGNVVNFITSIPKVKPNEKQEQIFINLKY